MSDQIQSNDKVYLAQTGAWHGKGTIFPKALGGDAVREHVCPWEPAPRFCYYYSDDPRKGGKLMKAPDRKVIVRGDTGDYLGTVGIGYSLMGNREMFDLVEEALPGCKYETAGTLFGQRRIWALAQIDSFEAVKGDETKQYLMVANGHDGSFSLFFGRTDVRVVCNNTLTMAISGGGEAREEGEQQEGVVKYKHTSKMKSRVKSAAASIAKAHETAKVFAEQAKLLAKHRLSPSQARDYFLEVFPAPKGKKTKTAAVNGNGDGASLLASVLDQHSAQDEVVSSLLNGHEEASQRMQTRHSNILASILNIYHGEKCAGQFGENAWTALNAITDWSDHERTTRGSDDTSRSDNRFASTVWGSGNQLKQEALTAALQLIK